MAVSLDMFSLDQVQALDAEDSIQDKLRVLQASLDIKAYDRNDKSRAFVDYYFGIYIFGKEEAQFTPAQVHLLLSIAHQVFLKATQGSTASETYALFVQLLRDKCSDLDPSIEIAFTLPQVELVVTFMTSTFFRHVRAYQYLFSHTRETCIHLVPLMIEKPLVPPPLPSYKTHEQE